MKYFVGFLAAVVMCVAIKMSNDYLLKVQISQFMCGWASCMAYWIVKEVYEELA